MRQWVAELDESLYYVVLHGKLQLLHNQLQKLNLREGFATYNRFPSEQKQLFQSKRCEAAAIGRQ